MDGPCFHRARAALDLSRRQKTWLTIEGLSRHEDALLSASLALWGRLRHDRTDRQREVAAAVQRADDQQAASRRLDVAPSTITRILQAAHYHELNRLKTATVAYLNQRTHDVDSPAGGS